MSLGITELELFIWAYLYSEANEQVRKWVLVTSSLIILTPLLADIWRGLRGEMYKPTKPFFAAHLPSAYRSVVAMLALFPY